MIASTARAPIAVFAYNRPHHLERAICSLLACPEVKDSPFYVFCDGPKTEDSVQAVEATREVARRLSPDHARIVISKTNRGLAASIEHGVYSLCQEYGRVIVVEDDLVVSNSFLAYMNMGLERYKDSRKVMQVSGFMFPSGNTSGHMKCALLPITTSWGWATWRSAWECYDQSASGWERLSIDKIERRKFNMEGAYDYYTMLRSQMAGDCDSWAIRWYWSVYKNKGLVLYPPESLVNNTGFDGSGTHGWRVAKAGFDSIGAARLGKVQFPETEVCSDSVYQEVVRYMFNRPGRRLAVLKKVMAGIRSMVSKTS